MNAPAPSTDGRLERVTDGQVLFGVCAGIGAGLGVDPAIVRIAFLIAIAAGGLGVIVYLIAAAAMPVAAGGSPVPREQRIPMAVGATVVVMGFAALAGRAGLLLTEDLIGPLLVVGAGVALIWRWVGGEVRLGWARNRLAVGVRGVSGVLLVAIGAALTLRQFGGVGPALAAALAAGTVAAGIGLLVTPSIRRARAEAEAERRERITSDERERVAARLHDSVLQTLALIQREPEAERARALARRQDRELRAWLYGREDPDAPTTLAGALRAAVSGVEQAFGVTIELVQSADIALDAPIEALVDASREAMTNAAKHAGVGEVNVLVRVGPQDVTVFVRDRGVGFDPGSVPRDRHGLRDSITARLERVGGRVSIDTQPGAGTDIALTVPRQSAA